MASRRFGYIPSGKDARDLDLAGLSLASSSLPAKFSIRQNPLIVLDQRSSSKCVGFGSAQAVLTAERHAGVHLELPSPRFIYYNACRQSSGLLVQENGTTVRAAMGGLLSLGAPPESLWPFTEVPLVANRRPSFAAYMGAIARCGGEYRRIFETGPQRTLAMKAAIVAGMPPVFGTAVGNSFMNTEGSDIIGPPLNEQWAGMHCMLADGYEDVPGGTLFDCLNSWGTTWRAGGTWRMTQEYAEWPTTDDIWVVRGWRAMAQG